MSTTGTSMTGTSSSSAASTTEAAKGAASEVASEATSAAADATQTVKAEVGSVVSDAADRAGAVLQTSRQELRTQVETKAKDLSSVLDSTASQLASMAKAADDPSSPVATLASTAAEQLRRQGQRLDEGGIDAVLQDARRLARNRPGVFMLGAIGAGFAFGRLAKHADLKQAVTTAKEELTGGEQQSSNGTNGIGTGPSFTGAAGAQAPAGDGGVPAFGTVPGAVDPTGPSAGFGGGS